MSNKNKLRFLSGGGEMGELTRRFDWSSTSLGSPENWPQSLNLTLSMILSSKFPMFLWWGDDLVQFYNDAYRPSLGNKGKHPEALGQKAEDCWPEIWGIIYPLIQQVRNTAQATWHEDLLVPIYRNGRIEDVYWTFGYSPIFGESGHVDGVLVVCTETTEKIRIQQAIQKSERNFRSMILQAPVAMCILLGPEHIVEVANQLIIELWGKPAADVMYKPIFEGLPDAREQGLEKLLADVYTTGETFRASEHPVLLLRNGNLETVYQNFVYEPYRDTDGTILGVIAITIDVTEQVLARQRVEKSQEELLEIKSQLETELAAGRQLQQQKDDFIGIASHELKTPLTALKGSMQLLSRWTKDEPLSERIQSLINLSNTSIGKLSHLLEELLNDTKINEGQLKLKMSHFILADVVNESHSHISVTGKYQILIKGDKKLEVFADRQRIEQVLVNFINNAVKYAPLSETIVVLIEPEGENVKVSVIDKGPGIPAEKLPHLFKRYYRVDTSGIQYSGLGLGLFISSEIIHRHKGEIGVESVPGQGSTFWFTIPLEPDLQAG